MKRRRILAGLGLAGLVALFWVTRLAWGGHDFQLANADLYLYFYPIYESAYRRLAAGDLPLWNPYQLCGLPWLATMQGGFFYPGHVLYLVLPTHLALAASTVLHLVLIALGTALFARRAQLGPAAAALAAVLFTLRGVIPNLTLFPNALEAVAWLPLGGVAVLGLVQGEGAGAMALLAVATAASLLAGYPQTTVYLVYAWAALLVALLLGERAALRRWGVAAGTFAAAVALGALAAGIQLVPAAELTWLGTRQTRELAMGLMFPMGTVLNPVASNLEDHAITGSQFSFGVVGPSLLPVALLARRHRPLALWALGLGLVSLAFALGPATPLFRLYFWLPLLSWFRLPGRMFVLTEFCFALLAGIALDTVSSVGRRPAGAEPRGGSGPSADPLVAVGAPAACALVLGGFAAWHGTLLPAFIAVACAFAIVAGRWVSAPLPTILLLVAAVEVFAAPAPSLSRPYTSAKVAAYDELGPIYDELRARAGHERVWLLAAVYSPELGLKQPTRYGLRSIADYEPLNLRRQSDYFTYLATASTRVTRHFDGAVQNLVAPPGVPGLGTRRRLLDLAGMRFFLPTARMLGTRPEVRRFVTEAGLVPRPNPTPGLGWFENPNALPRAFTVYRTRPAPPPDDLLRQMSLPSFDPMVESFVEGAPDTARAPDAPERGEAATFLRDEERLVEVEAKLAVPGLLVLADSFYPGWRATVDGVPAPIFPTNHLFRGVPVPAGQHRVRFEYHPWTFPAGATCTLVAIAILAAVLLRARRRRRLAPV